MIFPLSFKAECIPSLDRLQAEFLQNGLRVFLKTFVRPVKLRQFPEVRKIPMTKFVREGRKVGVVRQTDDIGIGRKPAASVLI